MNFEDTHKELDYSLVKSWIPKNFFDANMNKKLERKISYLLSKLSCLKDLNFFRLFKKIEFIPNFFRKISRNNDLFQLPRKTENFHEKKEPIYFIKNKNVSTGIFKDVESMADCCVLPNRGATLTCLLYKTPAIPQTRTLHVLGKIRKRKKNSDY